LFRDYEHRRLPKPQEIKRHHDAVAAIREMNSGRFHPRRLESAASNTTASQAGNASTFTLMKGRSSARIIATVNCCHDNEDEQDECARDRRDSPSPLHAITAVSATSASHARPTGSMSANVQFLTSLKRESVNRQPPFGGRQDNVDQP